MESRDKLRIIDMKPKIAHFREEIVLGLLKTPKQISPKFFYDKTGSELFNRITTLEEYYLTRKERMIIKDNIAEICRLFQNGSALVEYGSGGSSKTMEILDHCHGISTYVPLDISASQLEETAKRLSEKYPHLNIVALCVDYTTRFEIPFLQLTGNIIALFLGSTIGNFEPEEASAFLWNVMDMMGPEDGIVIGVDLKKDPSVLEAAYNDSEGVTAQFNLNLITRINREFGTSLDVSSFSHVAFYNRKVGRIEMHLEVMKEMEVMLDGNLIKFNKGELIHTENSYKYDIEEFEKLARRNHLSLERVWKDPQDYFGLFLLRKI
ncbi:L-histidine N(alpha)-methyltransferase [Oxyplasma meridianum]|uniref:L-histidine N(Alpha)-methyltransferase n=1 Tax=Oxyplasma meridianum TaxID=3073602 RepID=A0AAX4NIG2_9ARCH